MPREGQGTLARRRRRCAVSGLGGALAALAPVGVALVKAGIAALEGTRTKEETARDTLAALLEAVPREDLIAYLTEGGIDRAEAAADLAESVKFDRLSDPLDEDEES